MKKILYILPIILISVVSCKEDTLDTYSGENYIHFTPGVNDIPETTYNFALDGKTTAEMEAEVPVEIRLWGFYHEEKNIKCNVSIDIDKTTALPDYYVDPESVLFLKQQPVCTLYVKVKREPELLSTDYKVVVNLDSADEWFVVAPEKYNSVTIHVVDQIPSQPMWWETTQVLGAYSAIKYRLFNIYMQKFVVDISAYTADGFREEINKFKVWLQTNVNFYPEAQDVLNSIP